MAIISKTYSRILAALLAWFGFSAIFVTCKAAYGTPSATYKAKGVVVSEKDGAPIEGIRAILKTQEDATWGMETVYTDSKGVFKLKSQREMFDKLYVELTDVDGEKNGSFNDKDVEVDFSHVKFKGSSWDDREVEKDLGTIKLKPKE